MTNNTTNPTLQCSKFSIAPSLAMKQVLAKVILSLGVLTVLLSTAGCEAPEGGSSIPWNRPQQWERQGIGGIGY